MWQTKCSKIKNSRQQWCRAKWPTHYICGCPDISESKTCGQPLSDMDIRISVTQGCVNSPSGTRISGHWSLRAVWTALLRHGYPDIGHSGLCGHPSSGYPRQLMAILEKLLFWSWDSWWSFRQMIPKFRNIKLCEIHPKIISWIIVRRRFWRTFPSCLSLTSQKFFLLH